MSISLPHTPRRVALILIACLACALAAGMALNAAPAGAQAVTEEYELGPLPDSESSDNAPNSPAPADTDDDGAPLVWIVIGVGAILGVALGAWYVSRHRKPGNLSADPPASA